MHRLTAGASATVRVPASTANLGPGFDSIGLALGIWDVCTATVTGDSLVIEIAGEGATCLPLDAQHLVHRAMVRAWAELGVEPPPGLRLECRNAIPQNRGLGSSAAAVVAGIVAAQALSQVSGRRGGAAVGPGSMAPADVADQQFTADLASEIEGHPDNASASVFGGATLSWRDDVDRRRTRTLQLTTSPDLEPVVLVPAAELSTRTARAVLAAQIPHADAAANSARSALLVEALARRSDLLLPATREWLHQEARRSSFPASMRAVDDLRAQGHAAVISGAGPSVLVLATRQSAPAAASMADPRQWLVLTPGIAAAGVSVTAWLG